MGINQLNQRSIANMMKYYKFLVIFLFLFSSILLAQNYTISGTVESTKTGEKLIGADVYLMGADIGAATDVNGKYKITAPGGTYQVICSYIGYQTKKVELHLKKDTQLNFSLEDHQFVLNVTVLADRATENETPVAFSNIEKKGLELRLGSRDIPMVLNTTPSVYATEQGEEEGVGSILTMSSSFVTVAATGRTGNPDFRNGPATHSRGPDPKKGRM